MTPDITSTQPTVTTKKGSPWSGLGRCLTDSEYKALKAWAKENPGAKYKMGDMRDDGLCFRQYSPTCNNGELWGSVAMVRRLREIARLNAAKKRSPEFNAERNRKRRSEYAKRDDQKRQNAARHLRWRMKIGPAELSWRRKAIMRKANKVPRTIQKKKEWFDRNRHRLAPSINDRASRRRARIKYSATFIAADDRKIRSVFTSAKQQEMNDGVARAVDHIIPLIRGGVHHEHNLQVLPFGLNSEKHDDPFWLSDEYLDFRDVPESLWPDHLRPHYQLILRLFGHPLKKYSEVI